jgi:hypothetical protein
VQAPPIVTPAAAPPVMTYQPKSSAAAEDKNAENEMQMKKTKKSTKLLKENIMKKENQETCLDPFSTAKPAPVEPVQQEEEVVESPAADEDVDDWENLTDKVMDKKAEAGSKGVSLRPGGGTTLTAKASSKGNENARFDREIMLKYRIAFQNPFAELKNLRTLPNNETQRAQSKKGAASPAIAKGVPGRQEPPNRSQWGTTQYPAGGKGASKLGAGRAEKGRSMKDIKLHKSENAYKVGKADDDASSALKRNVKSMLNKITAENFSNITEKLASVELTQASDLDVVIDLVFDKAVTEHAYCEMYADMCLVLRTRFPEFPAQDDEEGAPTLTFTRALLNRCQEEFENLPLYLGPSQEQKDTLGADELEVIVKKQKDRVLGNMKFIGQLYLRKLLSHKVVREVVVRLVFKSEPPEEHYIECFCMLVRNIGATLESSDQGKSYMQQFANRMKDLAASNDYSKRIKFAIQDVLELRTNNWQERVLKEQMKTKDQIRKDAVREARAQQGGAQNPYASMQIAGQRPQYITAVMEKQEAQRDADSKARRAEEKDQKAKAKEEGKAFAALTKAIAYFQSDFKAGTNSSSTEADLVADWKKANAPESDQAKALKEMIDTGFNNANKAPAMVTAILALLKGDVITWRVLEAELAKQTPFLSDSLLDNPNASKFYEDLVAGFLTINVKNVPSFEGAFKPLTQLDDKDLGFEVLIRVLETVKASKGLPGLKGCLQQMRGPLMELKGLETKDALHDLLMERKLFRDVTEVIKKVEDRFRDNDFTEEGFMSCIEQSYGDERPPELQSDEFLMRFIEAWMRHSKHSKESNDDPNANWQNRASASLNMFQNEILNLIPMDDDMSKEREKRQHLLLEAVAYAASAIKLPDEELVFLLQAMFDMGMLAETIIFKWASDTGDSTEEKKRCAAALRKISEDGM